MTKQSLNLGSAANDNTGDTLRAGGSKINDNFNELYAAIGNGATIQIDVANAASGQILRYNGTNFIAADYTALTAALDTNNNSIISSANQNITIAPNGTGDIRLSAGSVTNVFDGTTGNVDLPTKVTYKNEYASLAAAPTAADYPGYFFTIDGDDKPYVNMNITTGGVGDTRVSLLTQYTTIGDLSDIDVTTTPPTNNQVLKWDGTNWVPGDDNAGVSSITSFATVNADTGTTTASSESDALTIAGGSNITTSIAGDTVTIAFNGTLTTTLAALTDTDVAGITQGDSLYWNGSDWVVTRSPITWWELNADGIQHYTFAGPGFTGTAMDPTLYVMRGMTYAFDNSVQGGGHPFRIQSSSGLSGTPYTDGQTGSGSSVLYWTVPMNAPSTLYYQCTLHSLMNGTITVVS